MFTFVLGRYVAVSLISTQTPSTGLRHPSSIHRIVDYAIGLEKRSANEQFFDDAEMAESL